MTTISEMNPRDFIKEVHSLGEIAGTKGRFKSSSKGIGIEKGEMGWLDSIFRFFFGRGDAEKRYSIT